VRKQVKDLPLKVVLDDSMAMMPQLKLSGFEAVKVGARISLSGTPKAQAGDLFSEKTAVKAGDQIELVIDSIVE
jgi:cytochrome c-type biogenesis protein CcmH